MGVHELIRVSLYALEWIWTTVILIIFPVRLAKTAPTINNTIENICLFNASVGRSRCEYGLIWSVIGLIILTSTIVWYGVEYCTRFRLPERAEMLIFSWLAIWWLVGSITFTVTKSSRAPAIATIPVVFAWMLFVFCLISVLVASRGPIIKMPSRSQQAQIQDQDPESVDETTLSQLHHPQQDRVP